MGHHTPILARQISERTFKLLSILATLSAVIILGTLLSVIIRDGVSVLSWEFLTSFPSRFAHKAGIKSALFGTVYLMGLTAVISFPVGVAAAIYLEEYSANNRFAKFLELNIANLAAVPSVIYGLLGLEVFVRFAGFDRSLLAGACTLSLLILPIIIISSREALRIVPPSLREGALALGATKSETICGVVLPIALPGILTGSILAFSRAIGETAPLVTLGALTFIPFVPDSLFSPFSALPIQAFNWLSRPQAAFHANAAGAILVLLIALITLNGVAIVVRNKFQRKFS